VICISRFVGGLGVDCEVALILFVVYPNASTPLMCLWVNRDLVSLLGSLEWRL